MNKANIEKIYVIYATLITRKWSPFEILKSYYLVSDIMSHKMTKRQFYINKKIKKKFQYIPGHEPASNDT